MGKKRRILRSPKFAHLRQMRKWQTLVEANLQEQSPAKPILEKEEQVVETPTLKLVEEEAKINPYELPVPDKKQDPPPAVKKKAVRKKASAKTTKVAAKKKPATKTRIKKTTSKK